MATLTLLPPCDADAAPPAAPDPSAPPAARAPVAPAPREPVLVVGALPLAENVRRLDALRADFESALGLTARWIVSTPETAWKIQLGKTLWHFASSADALARRRAELDDAPPPGAARGAANAAFAAAVEAAGRADASAERLALLYEDFVPALARAVDAHRGAALSFGDGVTEWALDPVAVRLRALVAWYERSGPRAPGEASPARREARARLHGPPGPPGGRAGAGEAGPAAVDATPAREPGLVVCDPVGPRPESFLMFLHSTAFNVEICATEVCAALLVEYPMAPWGLKLDLARQIYDEVRHAESLLGRLGELGGSAGQFPIDLRVWRSFCAGETLAEKLILQHRIGEGGGLDGGALVARGRRREGDERTAQLFEYINADEINHVRAGNRWIDALLAGDARELAALEAKARGKLAALGLDRLPLPPWAEGRRRAGFGDTDVASAERAWRAYEAARKATAGPWTRPGAAARGPSRG